MNIETKKLDVFNVCWMIGMLIIALLLDLGIHQRITFWLIVWFASGTITPFLPEVLKRRNPFKKYEVYE